MDLLNNENVVYVVTAEDEYGGVEVIDVCSTLEKAQDYKGLSKEWDYIPALRRWESCDINGNQLRIDAWGVR